MYFFPGVDFYIFGRKLLLTRKKVTENDKRKLTGTKIPCLFNLADSSIEFEVYEDDDEEETERSLRYAFPKNIEAPFGSWAKIFDFPYVKVQSQSSKGLNRKIEEIIKNYIESQLKKEWDNYPIDQIDVFFENDKLGGVPDGEELDSNGNLISILEIKTIKYWNQSRTKFLFDIPLSFQLQIGLYMYLRNVDIGYVCVCYLTQENRNNTDTIMLKTSLNKLDTHHRKLNISLEPWDLSIGLCDYSYELIDVYRNDFSKDNPLILFKFKMDLSKYKLIIDRLLEWYDAHKSSSPEMTEKEFLDYIAKNKEW